MSLLKRFYKYQKERFPLIILIFTTFSSTLVSVAVTGNTAKVSDIIIIFFTTLFFLYHIRVIDESRDTAYDKKNYPERPVQKGTITIKELFTIDIAGLLFNLVIAIYYGYPALIYAITIFIFTTLAWKDFFAPKFFENKPLLYHLVNSPQMILIQLFIYALITHSFLITKIMWIQILLVYINIFILELVRKIKNPDSKASDVYSNTMGFKKAMFFNLCLEFSAFIVFIYLNIKLSQNGLIFIIGGSGILVLSIISFISHICLKSKITEKLMLLSGFLTYVGLNSLIYLTVVYGN